jgi:thioredoxin 1
MRFGPLTCGLAVLLVSSSAVVAVQASSQQSSAKTASHATSSSTFASLEQWKAAVVAGDKLALAALYSTSPAAAAETPQGKTQDPNEEPSFWSSLHAEGLGEFNPKILEMDRPQAATVQLTLRIQGTLRTSSGEQPFVVSAAQVWVQQGNDWRIVATKRGNPNPVTPRRLPEPAKPNPNLYPDAAEAPAEIAAALAAAAKDHKRVILVFGGNWCYDCHVLDATFHSKDIAPLVETNYHVVHINIGEYDKNLDLAQKYEVPLNKGVPSLAVLDADGKLVFSQKHGDFENTTRIGPDDVVKFLNQWRPPHGP